MVKKTKKNTGGFMTVKVNPNGTVKNHRQRCEVYSRIVGYLRPVSQWHSGKQAEFHDRKEFKVE
jgi:anaerobic ribonucleoside-triphosphate reductase